MANDSSGVTFLYDKLLDNPATTIRIYRKISDDGKGYSELVAKGFHINDVFLNIVNSWGSDDSQLISMLVDGVGSAVTSRTGKAVTGALSGIISSVQGDVEGSTATLLEKAQSFLSGVKGIQNSAFLSSNDFYKTFKGTQISFPTSVQLEFVSDQYSSNDVDGKSSDVYLKLAKILGVAIGDYRYLGGFAGIQAPPNGYETNDEWNLADPHKLSKGTMSIVWGDVGKGGVELRNVVIASSQVTMSKTKVEIAPNVWRPLSITVNLTFEPSKKYTKQNLMQFLGIPAPKDAPPANFMSRKFWASLYPDRKENLASNIETARSETQDSGDTSTTESGFTGPVQAESVPIGPKPLQ